METRSVRGFHDVLPEDVRRWQDAEEKAKHVFALYGYSEIRVPVLEFTDIFARSLGTTTDIVEKEMYTFTDRDGSSLTLRPEGTAGVVRAYIENSMWAKSPVTKLYYTGMMFRHERPQKGRFRGFYQIGAELLGPEEPASDAEMIAMVWKLLESIGIAKFLQLELSSLGDGNCRPQYKEKLVAYFTPQKEKLCEDCRRRLTANPLRILDCKVKGCREVAEGAPKMLDNMCDDCAAHFNEVRVSLEAVGIPYVINPKIVRGLDYYTRTVFEITTGELGSQNAVAAGGRYDGLIEELGGTPPKYTHAPLMTAPDGRKLSKREGDLNMETLRQRYSPEELLGHIAAMSGLRENASPVTAKELAADFSWDRVSINDIIIDI